MKKRIFWGVVLCVALLAAIFSIIMKSRSGRILDKQEYQEPVRSINTVLEEIKRMPLPETKPSCLVCPFTDTENRITTQTLAIYFPALFKISYSPDCLVKTPFPPNVRTSAWVRKFFQPGKTVTEDELQEFTRIFGCRYYITGAIQKGGSKIQARITISSMSEKAKEKTFVVEESRANLLPNKIASRVLTELTGAPLPEENRKYLDIPCAKNPEILQRAAEVVLIYYNSSRQLTWNDFTGILEKDPEMDWFVPIYLNILPENQDTVNLAEKYMLQWKDRPRFELFYTAKQSVLGQNGPVIMRMPEIIRRMPDNPKVYEVLGSAVQENKKPSEAAPFFQRMIDLAPDDAWFGEVMGAHKIELAWEHRGSGWASTVTEEGWKNFFICLGEARECLVKSIALDQKNFRAYADMITVGMGSNLSLAEIRGYFDKAVEINPDYRDAYSKMMCPLMPKWGGSMPQLYSFWGEILNKDIKNHYVYIVVVDACYEICVNYAYEEDEKADEYYEKFGKYISGSNIWPWIERSYNKFFSDGIEDTQLRSRYGYYATLAKKYELAFEQFEKSRMQFYGTRYFRYEDVLRKYTRAALETGHYDKGIEIARKGIALNHCPGCNKNFQTFIDYAEKNKAKEGK